MQNFITTVLSHCIPLFCSDLKDSNQRVPYTPTARDPPLIRAVMGSLMPKAEVKVQKLDPSMKFLCMLNTNV